TGRRRALAGGALALLAQALSCGYYLVFFSPFAAAFVVWELTRRGRLRDRRAWTDFALAAVATGLVLTPFLLPYAEVQSTIRLERQIQEISLYSADVYAYVTSFPTERFWGPLLQIAPRPEGELFMGLIPLALGLLALGFVLADAWRAGRNTADTWPMLSRLCGAACIVLLALVTIALFTRRVSLDLGVASIRVTQLGRVLLWLLLSSGLWLLCSARARVRLRACFVPEGFFLASIVTAWWLSLGPTPRSFGRTLDFPALYSLLYALPGVDGLRVPARFAMVMALMLAVAAGYALARLCQRRHAIQLLAAIAALFLFEASPSSVSINGLGPTQGHPLPEARMYPPATAPLVYRTFAGLEGSTVLLELPIGDSTWDVRAVYYAAAHWRPLVNGYSGFFPPHYGKLILGLSDPDRNPESAWQTLVDSGATHVLLHERAFREAEAAQIDRWLLAHQARVVMRADGDVLYDVRH
ncbi:MAG: hypothetical protein ABL982_26275, partial [Vicinamibacterales bacterium]